MKKLASIVAFAFVASSAGAQVAPPKNPASNPQTYETIHTSAYSGVIELSDDIKGKYGWAKTLMRVTVTKGVAYCEGVAASDGAADAIGGPGLIQVFFQDGIVMKYDSAVDRAAATEGDVKKFSQKQFDKVNPKQPVYSFEFACPDPGKVGQRATWNAFRESYNQPVPKLDAAGQRCFNDLKCAFTAGALPKLLCGTWTIPNPADDPINGQTGTLSLTWRLCQCVPPPLPKMDFNAVDPKFPPPAPCTQ